MSQLTLQSLAVQYLVERRAGREVCHRAGQSNRSVIMAFCAFTEGLAVTDITGQHVTGFLASRRISVRTWLSYDSTLRGWFKWMVRNDLIGQDPMVRVRRPRKPRTTPRGLPADVVKRLLEHVDGDPRATLIVMLMVQQGLRCIEVARCDVGQIDWHERTMLVIGKANHERILPITDETWSALNDYLTVRGRSAGPLVQNARRPGWGLTAGQISRTVSTWMREAEVAGTPHGLRHTCAQDILRGGANLRDLQQLLGHASLETTQHYLPLVVHDLRLAMNGRQYRHSTA